MGRRRRRIYDRYVYMDWMNFFLWLRLLLLLLAWVFFRTAIVLLKVGFEKVGGGYGEYIFSLPVMVRHSLD